MFKIKNLLSLFPNEKTREMLLYSYYSSQEKDKDLSDSVFEQLLLLKEQYTDMNIIFDATKESSYFSSILNVFPSFIRIYSYYLRY